MMALASLILGFLLLVVGIGLWSVPAACVVAGLMLFVSGGLELKGQTLKGQTTRRPS